MVLDGFWSGAIEVSSRVPVASLARQAGGWAALQQGGPVLWRQLGVHSRHIEIWRRAKPLKTAFTALTADDRRFPGGLQVEDGPPVLFVDGDPEVLQQPAVAIVGTRKCTDYGVQMARGLAATAVSAGRVTVSGLAFGIDRHAHEASIQAGRTVAVLPGGLARITPRAHAGLHSRILARGGAIVSTWPDGYEARRWTFPSRNRWIAALSTRTVVVEAPLRSGALYTAHAAARYGRLVDAVPGPVGALTSEGCNALIQDGAGIITSLIAFGESLGFRAERKGWIEMLTGGASVEVVAAEHGQSVAELYARIHHEVAAGGLKRLPGGRYVRRQTQLPLLG